MKKYSLILFSAFMLLITACNNSASYANQQHTTKSWEQFGADTCNLTENGQRKGKWYIIDSAQLKQGNRVVTDTVFYKDGAIVN